VLVIWGRLSGHKKAARLLRAIYGQRKHVASLPELNVVAQAWRHTKYGEMVNFSPPDVNDLAQEVTTSLIAKHGRQGLLNAFF
jgi:hypothetical protein